MRSVCLLLILAGASSPLGCSSSTGTCEPGTVRHGYTCYPTDPDDITPPTVAVDPPARTRKVDFVRLTSSEPATIYYTTDGTFPTVLSLHESDRVVIPGVADDARISFFAVDLNGNASPVQTVVWQIDRNGPGAPMPVALEVTGAMRKVTWSPPTGDPTFRGVLLARVEGTLTVSPEPGRVYQAGDELAPGVVVVANVAAGFAGAFSESRTSPIGMVRYVAWSFDDLYNYGSGANAFAADALAAQTAEGSAFSATGAVTFTSQPANMTISGTAALESTTLTVTLEITNATSRPLFAPKLLLTNTLTTATWSDENGVYETYPYRALGAVLLPGGKVTTTLQFDNVTSGDVVPLSFDVRHGRILVAGSWDEQDAGSAVDEATNEIVKVFNTPVAGLGFSGEWSARGGGVTLDGHFVTGSRTTSQITSFDLATGMPVLSIKLAAGKSQVARFVTTGGGGTGYGLVAGGHSYSGRNEGLQTELVSIDTASLRETGRVAIGTSRNRDIQVSSDGRYVAIATGTLAHGTVIVDASTMSVKKRIITNGIPSSVAFSPESASLVVGDDTSVRVYSVGDFSETKRILNTSAKVFGSGFASDGRFYMGREASFIAVDLATDAIETVTQQSAVFYVAGTKIYACDEGSSQVDRYDVSVLTMGPEASLDFDDSIYGHWVGHSPL